MQEMRSLRAWTWGLVLLLVLGFSLGQPLLTYAQTQEQITVTTYYPSPNGVYNTLRLFPNANPPACNATNEGVMYYDAGTNQLMVCIETANNVFQALPVQIGAIWSRDATNGYIFPANITDKVGIGTNQPTDTLHITGKVYTNGDLAVTGNIDVAGGLSLPNKAAGDDRKIWIQ